MPYIRQEARKPIDKLLVKLIEQLKAADFDKQDGNVNYTITKMLKEIYPQSYYNYNRAIGVLECIKQEFYRVDVAPYEDKKIIENGAVK